MAKRIMHKFRIDEISGVGNPAQKPARALIMKRDFSAKKRETAADEGEAMPDGSFPIKSKKDLENAIHDAGRAKNPDAARAHIKRRAKALGASDMIPDTWKSADPVAKGLIGLTEPAEGHVHSFRLDHISLAEGGGMTSTMDSGDGDGDCWHSHPFTIDADGRIRIGMAAEHTHDVEGAVEDILMGMVPDEDGDNENEMAGEPGAGDDSANKSAGSVAKATGEVEMNEKEVAELRALASMTDVQKAHYAKLDAGDREVFVKMSASERKTAIAKAEEADPVIYKSASTGKEYRASDHPDLIAIAKEADGLRSLMALSKAQNEEREITDLIAKFDHVGMSKEDKRLAAKSILAIQDEAGRKAALDLVMGPREVVKSMFKASGFSNVGKGVTGTAVDQLNQMAADFAKSRGVSFHKAFDTIVQSPKGAELYRETLN